MAELISGQRYSLPKYVAALTHCSRKPLFRCATKCSVRLWLLCIPQCLASPSDPPSRVHEPGRKRAGLCSMLTGLTALGGACRLFSSMLILSLYRKRDFSLALYKRSWNSDSCSTSMSTCFCRSSLSLALRKGPKHLVGRFGCTFAAAFFNSDSMSSLALFFAWVVSFT